MERGYAFTDRDYHGYMGDTELLQQLIDLAYAGNQAAFARAIGRQPAQVNQYLKGRRQLGVAAKMHIEEALHRPGWFKPGAPSMPTDLDPSNLSPVEFSAVPLISWLEANLWAGNFPSTDDDDDTRERLPCPAPHGPRTFCLRVRGDSMHTPGGRHSYADGDIIFVDPDRQASTGDRVIARLQGQPEATFKQLLLEDGRHMLKALNADWAPRYTEIPNQAGIVGVVIGKWVPE